MYNTQQALISHLQSAAVSTPAAQIKEYAGEVQKGMAGRINLPAILVLYVDGNPMSVLPGLNFELLFVASNKYLEKDTTKANALKFAGDYAEFLRANQTFEDTQSYYTLSGQSGRKLEDNVVETILNDHTYCILSLPVTVKANRQV